MSLFGNFGQRLGGLFASGGIQDAMAQAQAYEHGDYAAAASIAQNGQLRRLKIQQQQKAQQEQAQLEAMIDSDPNLPTPQAKAYAKANPKEYISAYMTRFQARQFGPEGGSLGLPDATGHLSFQTAPRFDNDGNIYAPGNGTSVPQVLQRGVKSIPVVDGGHLYGVDAITGQQAYTDGVPAGASPPPSGGPPMLPHRVGSKAEYDALPPGTTYTAPDGSQRVKPMQGGPAPQGPATFP